MTWFPSLPFLVLHLWATRELCGGGMCLSFIERRLPGTETESGNSRGAHRCSHMDSQSWRESGSPGKALAPQCQPVPTPGAAQPVPTTDWCSWREFPNGQAGRSRCVVPTQDPFALLLAATASTSPTQQLTPSGFPPPPPKPHQNQRISDSHHSKGLQRSPLVPGI